jgi:methionine sulfoxide reductase catalytic subunit
MHMTERPDNRFSIKSSEITPEPLFLRRRDFIKAAGVAAAGVFLAGCLPKNGEQATQDILPGAGLPTPTLPAGTQRDELGAPVSGYQWGTGYNNYYEFSYGKGSVAKLAEKFQTSPWQVEVAGLVQKPRTFTLEDLLKFPQEERIYRLRCVETWSMVLPWSGFPLAALLKEVEPSRDARFVQFTSASKPDEMPNLMGSKYPYPYREGLRLDEAMNDLTLLATGLYGKSLLPQNGAPVRLVVPWKYGFKSAKSIVRIELTAEQPATFWSTISPGEYGFYANVNPLKDHPRWSQRFERRIGEDGEIETLQFNGYSQQVASLYSTLDLGANY